MIRLVLLVLLTFSTQCFADWGIPLTELPSQKDLNSLSAVDKKLLYQKIQENSFKKLLLVATRSNGDRVYFDPTSVISRGYDLVDANIVNVYVSRPPDKYVGWLATDVVTLSFNCHYRMLGGKGIQTGTIEDWIFLNVCKK